MSYIKAAVAKLLGRALYDPATLATKTITAGVAMTAFDTTNLRVTFVATTTKVRVKMWSTARSSSTSSNEVVPFLGILDGSTIRLRKACSLAKPGGVTGSVVGISAEGLITGLTIGNTYTFDLAYGHENSTATGQLAYGGPNNATTGDAAGQTGFGIWEVPA